MKQESNIDDFYNQQRVIKHLQRSDWLFIVLPMMLAVVLLVIVPILWSIITRVSGNTTEIGGFNYDGLLIFAGIILFSVFCAGYGFLAFVLSLLTRRNITFRILLVVIPVLAAVGFYIFVTLKNSTDFTQ